ncbi:homocysteine S-methyltransferase family protein [Marivita sp. S6314]|nr:homocysteine S-methyltransferase family protein [Marivita sp. S6314]
MGRVLPHESDTPFLVYAGTGTDLIFNHGIELPGFSSFPLLETPETRAVLAGQMADLVALSGKMGLGCILDAPTWTANRDRAAPLGYAPESLDAINKDAVALMDEVRIASGRQDVLVSACIGPRYDPYADIAPMSAKDARAYHSEQMASLKGSAVDLVTAYTFNRLTEAVGVVQAAGDHGLPIILSFVVETDGCLADGTPLKTSIEQVDRDTDAAALFFMVNCAHPSHFANALTAHDRLKGVVVNASKCSHAELDEADTLDEGDPQELGAEVAALIRDNPAISVFGGCCGTDMRHLRSMAREVLRQ